MSEEFEVKEPCPCCGMIDKLVLRPCGLGEHYSSDVICRRCGVRIGVDKWNTRAPQSEWVSVDDALPIDINKVCKFESMEVLIVSGGKTEYCEFTCGSLPSPWFKFDNYHSGFVTHWMPLPTPPQEK